MRRIIFDFPAVAVGTGSMVAQFKIDVPGEVILLDCACFSFQTDATVATRAFVLSISETGNPSPTRRIQAFSGVPASTNTVVTFARGFPNESLTAGSNGGVNAPLPNLVFTRDISVTVNVVGMQAGDTLGGSQITGWRLSADEALAAGML